MISIITVNYNTYDFLQILIDSIGIFTKQPHEIIVIDNSERPQSIKGVEHVPIYKNIGHGAGLNLGSQIAKFPFIMFVDSDTHFLKHQWDEMLLKEMQKFDVVGGKGSPSKPIRPACLMTTKEIATKYDWCCTPGYHGERGNVKGYDVAISAYNQMISDNLKIKLLESKPSHYKTINGENYILESKPICYHHWSSSYLAARQKDFKEDLFADKDKLFSKVPWNAPFF